MTAPVTLHELLFASPRLDVQLALWRVHTVIWFVITNKIAYPIILKVVQNMEAKARLIKFTRSQQEKMGIDIEDDNIILSITAGGMSILVQHAIGGLLCLPSAIGIQTNFAFAMARHGMLCELGWETQDTLVRIFCYTFGGKSGKERYPLATTIFACVIHHVVSFSLVIPMNIYYPDWSLVHEMACLLELAAAVAGFTQYYGYTKDVKTHSGLRNMKISIIVTFAIMIWSRMIRYFWLAWIIGRRTWKDGNILVFTLMCVSLFFFTLFNILIMIDAIQKLLKFLPMRIEHHDKEEISKSIADVVYAPVLTRRSISVDTTLVRSLSHMSSFRNSFIAGNKVLTKKTILELLSTDADMKEE